MDTLEYFQNSLPGNDICYQRKVQIEDSARINLFGPRGAGKSTLALEYLQDFDPESVLYIDCEDPALRFETLDTGKIEEFIRQNDIETLVIDHMEAAKLDSLPEVEKIILISRSRLRLEGFTPVELFPLDYEEFLSFDRGTSQITSFNHFLRLGTLPLMSKYPNAGSRELKTFLKSAFDAQEISLLCVLSSLETRHLSVHQIYTAAKERFKVSKDWLYRKIREFESEGVIRFLDEKYLKGGRKLILFDFALAKYLYAGQPFIHRFDAMTALALIKHRREFETLGIHGYLTANGELIVPSPFESEESFWKKSHSKFSILKKYGVQKVSIVTVSNSYSYTIEKIGFEATPFYEWSILNEEDLQEAVPAEISAKVLP